MKLRAAAVDGQPAAVGGDVRGLPVLGVDQLGASVAETTSASSMPGRADARRSPAMPTCRSSRGCRCRRSTPRSARRLVDQRRPVDPPVRRLAGEADRGAEDVGAVVLGRPGRVRRDTLGRREGAVESPPARPARRSVPSRRGRRRGSRSRTTLRRRSRPVPEVRGNAFGNGHCLRSGSGSFGSGRCAAAGAP